MILAVWLFHLWKNRHREGDVFKGFMAGYLGSRLFADALKPGVSLLGLTAIQWACVSMLLYYAGDLPYLFRFGRELSYD